MERPLRPASWQTRERTACPDRRRSLRAFAPADPDRTSRYTARRRWRHPGPLPAVRRRRRAFGQAAATLPEPGSQRRRRGAGRRRGTAGRRGQHVWADTQTNALVINAPPKMMRSLMQIVDKLDIRRAQVLVEAIIVEVIADKTAELGITWAVEGNSSNTPIGVTNFPDFRAGCRPARLCRSSRRRGCKSDRLVDRRRYYLRYRQTQRFRCQFRAVLRGARGRCGYQHHFDTVAGDHGQ